MLRVVLGDLLRTGHVILRMRSKFVAFIMGKRYFLPITWLNLRRSAVKVRKRYFLPITWLNLRRSALKVTK